MFRIIVYTTLVFELIFTIFLVEINRTNNSCNREFYSNDQLKLEHDRIMDTCMLDEDDRKLCQQFANIEALELININISYREMCRKIK